MDNELADLFVEWGTYQELFLERFIYLLFAFIVAGHLVAIFAVTLTLASAYLAAAYLVGAKLTKSQVLMCLSLAHGIEYMSNEKLKKSRPQRGLPINQSVRHRVNL